MTSEQPLTSYLEKSCPAMLEAATKKAAFLESASKGQVSKHTLSQWLSQDRLYAQCYIRFAAGLLAKIRLPMQYSNTSPPTLYERIMDILVEALVNVRRELAMFGHVADKYGLDLVCIGGDSDEPHHQQHCCSYHLYHNNTNNNTRNECSNSYVNMNANVTTAPGTSDRANKNHGTASVSAVEKGCNVFFGPNPITKAYMDLYMSAASSGTSLLEGLVVLWASELFYLRAWTNVSNMSSSSSSLSGRPAAALTQNYGDVDVVQDAGSSEDIGKDASSVLRDTVTFKHDADGGALREMLVPNWTNDEFARCVAAIGDVVDELAGQEVKGVEQIEKMRGSCLEWWRQVLWLEKGFWPVI